MTGVPTAIVDPGTLLGRDLRDVLEKRAFPAAPIHLLQSVDPASGYVTDDGGEAAYVAPLAPDSLEGCRIAFLCGTREATARFSAARTLDGCVAIDLSGARSGGPFFPDPAAGPLPVAPLLLLRNPVAIVVAEVAACLGQLAPLAALTVAVDRPASELGKMAVDELFQQALSIASFRPVPTEVLGCQGAFNQYRPPDTPRFDAEVEDDLAALTGGGFEIAVLSLRASVFHGTAVRLEARFKGAPPAAAAARAGLLARKGRFVEPGEAGARPGTLDVAGQDETLVLGVESRGGSLRVSLATDHLRGPRAVLAVELAERLLAG